MPVTDVPASALDNTSDLMAWLADELVANYHFTEKVRYNPDIPTDEISIILERLQATTYHNETDLTLMLYKNTATDTNNRAFSFNMSPSSYDDCFPFTAEQSVVVDWDSTNNRIEIQSGDFTNWSTAGYENGDVLQVSGAATAAHNGLFSISSITNDGGGGTLNRVTVNVTGQYNDVVADDLGDTITVRALPTPAGTFSGIANVSDDIRTIDPFWNVTGRSNEILWNWGMSGLEAGNYVRARLITSPTADSATPSEELYFILIVESQTDVYRQMSFGEAVKAVDAVTGCWFASGSDFQTAQDIDAENNSWLQGIAGSTSYNENFNTAGSPFCVWAPNYAGVATDTNEYGFGWHMAGAYGSGVSFDAPTQFFLGVIPHYWGNGKELIGYSPSAFSGQSERWPITCYGGFGNRGYVASGGTYAPLCTIPDVFLAEITNVDAYSVFEDDYGERFLVVPIYSKAGSGDGSSEKWGYLIRNPALVVT